MTDPRNDTPRRLDLAPLAGFALGALVGGVAALLLAPASGARTRRRLGDAARHLGRDAQHSLGEARESLMDTAKGVSGEVRAAVESGRDAFQDKLGDLQRAVAARPATRDEKPVTRES